MNEELKKKIDEMYSNISQMGSKNGVALMDKLFKEVSTLATTLEERQDAGKYLRELLDKRKRSDIDIKKMLADCSESINLSYIAKRYFNRDRTWLYQRINGTSVNGKPATFSEQELKTLSDSLREISSIISETSLLIKNSL